jgi:uncharacterized phage protein (TIGR01671 family)
MREIKFRMITQTTAKLLGYVDIYDLLRNGVDVLPEFEEAVLDGVKFEQYTGLKDKNGKEIYDGDIVKMPSTESAIVGYDAASFILNCTHCTATWDMNRWCSELGLHLDNICTEVEVIGNIHENPELLGEE